MKHVTVEETNLQFRAPLNPRQATRFFVVHHIGKMPAGIPPERIDADMINDWHIQQGWAGIGYHYVIKTDGVIERGRPRYDIGSQCKNHNYESIGICVVGDFTKELPNDLQMESLAGLLADLCSIYGLIPDSPEPEQAIRGHRQLVDTECPGDALYGALPGLRTKVRELCGFV